MSNIGNRLAVLLAPALQRWRRLDQRQQTIIAWASIALIVAFLFAYVWLPASRERDRLTARLPQLKIQLATMQKQLDEVRELNRASPVAPAPPVAADAGALQSAFGDGTRASVDNDRAFKIVIPKITYALWWDRLGDVEARHRLQLVSLNLQALPGGNREVSVEMVLANRASGGAAAATGGSK